MRGASRLPRAAARGRTIFQNRENVIGQVRWLTYTPLRMHAPHARVCGESLAEFYPLHAQQTPDKGPLERRAPAGSSQAAAMPAAEKEPEVWIANPVGGTDHPYVRAVMVATDDRSAAASNLGARCVVRPVGGGPEVQLHTSEVHPCNPSGHRPDNTQLLYLNEPCVIENIAHRYEELVLAAAYRAPATATASPFPLTLAPSPPPSRRSTRGPPASSSRSTLTRRSATCTTCTYP